MLSILVLFGLFCSLLALDQDFIVYRADMLSPADLKLQQKFLPRGIDGTRPNQPPADISLINHVRGTASGTSTFSSGYVSTTTRLSFAQQFLHDTLRSHGYIYYIHVAPNFIDADATLLQFNPHPMEAEFSALGGILYTQVLGWVEYNDGVQQPYVVNRDYDARLFGNATHSGAQPQLAGFPDHHVAWSMEPWRRFASCSLGGSSRRQVGDARCRSAKSAVQYASDFLHVITNGDRCDAIDRLTVDATLAEDLFAGTTDTILLQLADKYTHPIQLFRDPGHGQSVTVDVDLPTVFGQSQVPLLNLTRMTLLQKTTPHPIASDDFKMKGILLRARCVQTGSGLRHRRYASLDAWMTSPPEGSLPGFVWSAPLSVGDWEAGT